MSGNRLVDDLRNSLGEFGEAFLDERNLTIAIGGGLLSFVSGLGLLAIAPAAAIPAVLTGASITLVAYVGKSLYDLLNVTESDEILREVEGLQDELEGRLIGLYEQYRYSQNPPYTKREFEARREQLHQVFAQVEQLDRLFDSEGLGDSARQLIMPDIDKLLELSVRLYQRRLNFMGQLFAVVIGDNSAVELAEREVRRLLAEMEDARGDAELLNSLSAAHAAAQRHLEAVQQGVNSPEALGRMINLVEAQFDQARLTISQQFERVQAEVSAMSAGVQSLNQAAAAEELGRTVESLLATERAQNTVSAWMAGGEAGPVNAADVANVGLAGGALTSTVPQPTSQRRTSGTRSAVVRKGGEKR